MSFVTFMINLDRAVERRAEMEEQLNRLALPFTRIPAVLGDALDEPIVGFDERGFNIRTGKHKNKREIGCYFSHLKVIEAFLQTDAEHALVLEDDAVLPTNLLQLLNSAIEHGDKWDLLRLSSSRKGEFMTIANLCDGYSLAINKKVLKNTAAYMISRRAAKAILQYLRPMRLPYDVALDRDWTMGIRTACVTPFPVQLSDVPGQIPKAPRIRLYRSTTFHLLHLIDRLRRAAYRKKVAARLSDR